MTEKIQDTIQKISRNIVRVGEALRMERSKNEILQDEIDRKNEQLTAEASAIGLLKEEIESLKSALHLAENKVVEVPVPVKGKNEQEIDELVKEIEFCIEQLKQS
jgi:CRISPR/Cas system-associated exonuclease Cas4 (RecB family)